MMDWAEISRTLAAWAGLGLGLWNLISPRWTGVIVRLASGSSPGIHVTNTGGRPIFVRALGWTAAPDWSPHDVPLSRHAGAIAKAAEFAEVVPWRSVTFALHRRTYLVAGFERAERDLFWYVHLENGAVFTTLPWHRCIAYLKLRRAMRADQ